MKCKILYEDNHILVCHKPVGIAVQSGRVGESDMVSELKNYLAAGGKAPYLGVIHRLDQPVSGILVFAKTQKAAAELSRQASGADDIAANSLMRKEYRALVYLDNETAAQRIPKIGEKLLLTDYLLKDAGQNTSRVVSEDTKDAKKAVLELETEEVCMESAVGAVVKEQGYARVRVRLMTGRHHQIRVQCANEGVPLLGDTRYGSLGSRQYSMKKRIRAVALCAWKLCFMHPVTGKKMEFELEELPWDL